MTRIAWYLGNWIAAVVFAFRIGYRDGYALRPGTRPNPFRADTSAHSGEPSA